MIACVLCIFYGINVMRWNDVLMYSDRLQMLLDIYTEVNTACSPAAAKAVVSYTDHLKTLQDLETIAESACPSSM